jgi:hypothetical protein
MNRWVEKFALMVDIPTLTVDFKSTDILNGITRKHPEWDYTQTGHADGNIFEDSPSA